MLRFFDKVCTAGTLLTRREWLRIGGLSALLQGRTLQGSSPARRPAPGGFGRAKSVLLIFTGGGMSQLDTWDPKPDAPAEVRGEFRSIVTAVPGTRITEHLPRLARLAQQFALVRSVSHDDVDHGSASYLALTGQFHPRKSSNPPRAASDFPTYGAILKRVRSAERVPYTAVHVNGPVLTPVEAGPGQFGGFLGRANEPLIVGNVLDEATMPGLEPRSDLPSIRLGARRTLLQSIDTQVSAWRQQPALLERDHFFRQAYAFLEAPRYRHAFDLTQEPAGVRERYGPNRSGQACLLARRLIEVGVPWVTVLWNHMIRGQDMAPTPEDEFGWDTHNDIFPTLKEHLLPRLDQTLSALLEDLQQRGLLEETLVVCMGEFGRAPDRVGTGICGEHPGPQTLGGRILGPTGRRGRERRQGGRLVRPDRRLSKHESLQPLRCGCHHVCRPWNRSEQSLCRPCFQAVRHK